MRSNGQGLLKERRSRLSKMSIAIVPMGEINREALDFLRDHLRLLLRKEILIEKGAVIPDFAFNKKRNQYFSTLILRYIMENKEYMEHERVLGIVDKDLYVPGLNFVFGEAGQRVAVISTYRLRQEFYSSEPDRDIFLKRLLKEAVHELGHTYGLYHCRDASCVMFFSNSIIDTDRKGYEFCHKCKDTISHLMR